MMNRRNLVKSAAGLLVAAGAGELLLPERSLAQQFANAVDAEYRRTIWALDRTMVTPRFDAAMPTVTPKFPMYLCYWKQGDEVIVHVTEREMTIFPGPWSRIEEVKRMTR